MSKKDYELIARVLSADTPTLGHWQAQQYRRETAARFAAELAATNPRFNRARFLTACGVER